MYQQQQQYRFILRPARPQDEEVGAIIRALKAQRAFTRAIRIGLLLFWSLSQGRLDVLLREFPWVLQQLKTPAPALDQLQEQLRRIEAKMGSAAPLVLTDGAHAALPRPAKLPAPSEESLEDLLTVQAAKRSSDGPGKWNIPYCNLQLGLYQLGSIKHLTELETQVLEYGLHVGKLPAAKVKEILARRQSAGAAKLPLHTIAAPMVEAHSTGNARLIAGAGVEFAPPDDLDEVFQL
jgi:hypothetical protein